MWCYKPVQDIPGGHVLLCLSDDWHYGGSSYDNHWPTGSDDQIIDHWRHGVLQEEFTGWALLPMWHLMGRKRMCDEASPIFGDSLSQASSPWEKSENHSSPNLKIPWAVCSSFDSGASSDILSPAEFCPSCWYQREASSSAGVPSWIRSGVSRWVHVCFSELCIWNLKLKSPCLGCHGDPVS